MDKNGRLAARLHNTILPPNRGYEKFDVDIRRMHQTSATRLMMFTVIRERQYSSRASNAAESMTDVDTGEYA